MFTLHVFCPLICSTIPNQSFTKEVLENGNFQLLLDSTTDASLAYYLIKLSPEHKEVDFILPKVKIVALYIVNGARQVKLLYLKELLELLPEDVCLSPLTREGT